MSTNYFQLIFISSQEAYAEFLLISSSIIETSYTLNLNDKHLLIVVYAS